MMVSKNARLELRKYEFERCTFTGEFIRFGHTNNFATTVLLHDVKDESGKTVASHIWLNKAKPFYGAKLNHGDVVEFIGYVMRYKKGSTGRTTDFNIRYPSNVRNISDELECAVQY
jgi:hypothetical protein